VDNKRQRKPEWHGTVARIPDLVRKDRGDQHTVCRKLEELERNEGIGFGRAILPFVLLILVWAAVLVIATRYGQLNFYAALGIGFAVGEIIVVTIFYRFTRKSNNFISVSPLVRLLADLEQNRSRWDHFRYRVHVIRELDRVADRIERIPHSTGVTDPYVLKTLVDRAHDCATSLRSLQVGVAMPHSNAFDNLRKELTDRVLLLLDGKWYELPRADLDEADRLIEEAREKRRRRTRIIISVLVALLLLGASVFLLTILSDSVAALVVPFLLSTAVTVLGAGGVQLKALSDSQSITEQAVKNLSKPTEATHDESK
jgi:hypothetical protein